MSTNRVHTGTDRHEPLSFTYGRSERPTIRYRSTAEGTVVEFRNAGFLFAGDDITELSGRLRRLVDAGHTRLVLDLSGVQAMSSDVLGMFAELHRRLEKVGGCLRLTRTSPVVRDMLRICGLDRYLAVEPGCEPQARIA